MPSPSISSLRSISDDDSTSQKGDAKTDAFDSKPAALAHDGSSSVNEEVVVVSEAERKAERRLLWKLDLILLVWAWFAYVFKQVDSSNYKTAYVSGMKEALNFQGNELNYLDTLFRIGYALFLIPSQIILLKIRPSIWLPSLECAWGICTGLMAVMPSVKGMYALRFLIGVFEASSFPGITCILCSWYTPAELATRLAIFGSSYPAAQIFVGFMQVALHEGMEGHLGIPGWKWLFIFNAMMTIIIAGFGFFLIPDSPGVTRVFWLTKEENELSKRRMTRMNKLAQTPFTWATVKKIFSSWVLWVFMGAYSTLGWSQNSNTWITLWLKAVKNIDGTNRFGISELNAIPIGGYVLQILAMFAFAWASGRFGGRYGWIVAQQMTLVVGNIILSVWPESFAVKMLGFYILWLNHAAGAIMIAWMSDVCPSPEERAVVIGVACTWLYVVDAFANIFIYPAKQAPNYKIGYKAALAFALASIGFTTLFWYLAKNDKTRCKCNHAALVEQKEREVLKCRSGS